MPRGPYFKYLHDPNEQIPESTLRGRLNQNENNLENIVEDNADHEGIEQNDPGPDSESSSGLSSPHSEMQMSSSSGRSSPSSVAGSHMSVQSNASDGSASDQEEDNGSDNSDSEDSGVSDDEVNSEDGNRSEDRDRTIGGDVNSDDSASSDDEHVYDGDFDDDIPQNERIPLFDGCRITLKESRLLIISFSLRFGLSDRGIEHLLQLINCHLPRDEYESLYLFKKHIPAPPLVTTEFLCAEDKCQRLVRFENVENVVCECGAQCNIKTLKRDGHSFLTLSLKSQLVSMFGNRELCDSLRWESRNESDVISGRVYEAGLNNGLIRKECDLTLQFNTDGVQLFPTSSIQSWPIQVAVNELPFKLRKENIILCGLWYGRGKPNMNAFLMPFVEELNDLHLNGIDLPTDPPKHVKVHTILCSVDSVARAPLQNIKLFRGVHGCGFCLHPGEETAVGRGRARVCRGDKQQLRTARQHHEDVLTILRSNNRRVIRGIKGPSVLMTLHMFDICNSFVPDYLHCVLLGVVKTLFEFWTNGKNKEEPFYIGNKGKLDQFDDVFLTMKPPSELTKTPRTIHDFKLWRGHEWKNFLLYYSIPCLKAINFPAKYLNHYFLLVYSMFCFLSDLVTPEKLASGTAAIRKYVLTLEEIYSAPELMKYNTHLLLHIPESIRNYGGLWASSTFPFEHYNGLLAKMFRSSQAVPLQICKNYMRLQGLKEELSNIDVRVPSCMSQLLISLASGKRSKHVYRADRDLVFMGAPYFRVLSVVQRNVVETLVGSPINNTVGNVLCYRTFMYKNVKHHIEGCPNLEKRINCVVQIDNSDFISITHATKVVTVEDIPRTLPIFLGSKLQPTNNVLCADRQMHLSSNAFVKIVTKTNQCVAIWPHQIGRKCVFVPYPGNPLNYCCYPLVNLMERD